MRLGLTLSISRPGKNAAAAVIPTGGLLSLTAVDDTPIDPVSSIGTNGTSWVARVVLKGLTSLVGTVDASKLTISVSDPGYDTSGNATTITRTITGVAHMRRQYPNGASKMISTDGTDLTILVTLDDCIYTGTTIVSATLASGFYPSSAVGNAGTVTNQSDMAYPKPLFAWVTPQLERSSGTFDVEAVAYHRHARAGQQVACVKYTATDGTNNSATVAVGTPALSTRITIGNVPETFKGTLTVSGLTQAAACTVNAQVYPWIGNSSAVLDLAVDGVAWPTAVPQTLLKFTCDRTGGYGGAFAYVDGVGAGTPQVSTTAATAADNPYANIPAALSAIQTFNNANKGHNDLGGATVRLKDNGGLALTHVVSSDGPYTNAQSWCYIERDPAAVGAVTVTWTTLCQMSNMLAWGGNSLIIAPTAGQYAMSGNLGSNELVLVRNCTIDSTGATNNICLQNRRFFLNVNITGSVAVPFAGFGGASTVNIHLMAGVTATVANNPSDAGAQTMLGCTLPTSIVGFLGGEGSDGAVYANNKLDSFFMESAGAVTLSRGFAVVQNLTETLGAQGIKLFADGDHTMITNLVEMYNTGVGERSSRMYNDDAASKVVPTGLIKFGFSRFNIWDNINVKGDTFNAGDGSVGTMAWMYGVGNVGNASLFGAVGRGQADLPHNDNTDTPYLGNAWLTSSEPNVLNKSANTAAVLALFPSYTAAPAGVPALGGNYKPVAGATILRNRVPTGLAALKFDIAGVSRKNDGTGAAGAYEV
jgi:hypothetical protein